MVTKILGVFAISQLQLELLDTYKSLHHRFLHKTWGFLGRPIWLCFSRNAHDCWQTCLSTIFNMNVRLEIGR